MSAKGTGTVRRRGVSDGREREAVLPAWKAFVVQFSRETNPARGVLAGRVEHISSGRRAHFATPDELLAVLGKLLDDLGEKRV